MNIKTIAVWTSAILLLLLRSSSPTPVTGAAEPAIAASLADSGSKSLEPPQQDETPTPKQRIERETREILGWQVHIAQQLLETEAEDTAKALVGTEAYLSRTDFFPFTRAKLSENDPEMHVLIEQLRGVPVEKGSIEPPSGASAIGMHTTIK
jgi:hypothetical protein